MLEVLAEVTRGGSVESVHHGSIAVVDGGGRLVASAGDPDQRLYFRSSAKPFQAVPLVESGAADAFGLTEAELALCCASHSGTVRHQEVASGILRKLGLDEGALRCGASFPYDPKTGALVGAGQLPRSPLGCDCSGKHGGMLAVCRHVGYPIETYLEPEHPLQREILGIVAELCGVPAEAIPLGTDGCSLPTFGGRLRDFARAWAHLAAPTAHADALLRLRAAMLAHPENVAGDGVLDTDLMRAGGGGIVAKTGAEGLICLAIPERGLGVAIRIADGSFRALQVVVEATLRELGVVDPATLAAILPDGDREIRNHNKWVVGEIRATGALRTDAWPVRPARHGGPRAVYSYPRGHDGTGATGGAGGDEGGMIAERQATGAASVPGAAGVAAAAGVAGLEARVANALDRRLREAVASLDGLAPLLGGMAGYHLGFLDGAGNAVELAPEGRGKRFRPALAMLCCAAAGGTVERAGPLGAAIELLHNFTLVHDDIQDDSPLRRGRPTVWALWGRDQAINAGDALFALAHRALFRLRGEVDPATILAIADDFERTTLEIVSGQVLDLSFEEGERVTVDDYLGMIAGKTAAIVRFAAEAGATLGGSGAEEAARYGAFGLALGLGFQIQDDVLGIWGAPEVTGKAAADDIRRRKQSLPIVVLSERADAEERAALAEAYAAPAIEGEGVALVLRLLERHGVRDSVRELVRARHDEAESLLGELRPADGEAAGRLRGLVARLAERDR